MRPNLDAACARLEERRRRRNRIAMDVSLGAGLLILFGVIAVDAYWYALDRDHARRCEQASGTLVAIDGTLHCIADWREVTP